jgi:hypothetical protein
MHTNVCTVRVSGEGMNIFWGSLKVAPVFEKKRNFKLFLRACLMSTLLETGVGATANAVGTNGLTCLPSRILILFIYISRMKITASTKLVSSRSALDAERTWFLECTPTSPGWGSGSTLPWPPKVTAKSTIHHKPNIIAITKLCFIFIAGSLRFCRLCYLLTLPSIINVNYLSLKLESFINL